MAVAISGISTLGVIFSYGVETVSGQKPSTFHQLPRCNSISGIDLDVEKIDSSALEDLQTRYVAGRQDTGGDWTVTFNLTNETIPLIEAMMTSSATGLASSKRTWFQVSSPNLTKAFFVVGQAGSKVPMPDVSQNELFTGEISIAIDEYIGLDTKVAPTEASSST